MRSLPLHNKLSANNSCNDFGGGCNQRMLRGRHRRGGNFTWFLRFRALFHAAEWAFFDQGNPLIKALLDVILLMLLHVFGVRNVTWKQILREFLVADLGLRSQRPGTGPETGIPEKCGRGIPEKCWQGCWHRCWQKWGCLLECWDRCWQVMLSFCSQRAQPASACASTSGIPVLGSCTRSPGSQTFFLADLRDCRLIGIPLGTKRLPT